MTEAERKELIQKAFEAKQKLQEELAATKKEVEEKERELKRLQDEVCGKIRRHKHFINYLVIKFTLYVCVQMLVRRTLYGVNFFF